MNSLKVKELNARANLSCDLGQVPMVGQVRLLGAEAMRDRQFLLQRQNLLRATVRRSACRIPWSADTGGDHLSGSRLAISERVVAIALK
ncbi:hypothetical protein [Rhizobium leguminosarum]|uniref:hypothetical protein n=1 Tax=Rhizobium leguminosarum TaxID=384 RepID=UPI001A907598|nr:hypothetical protein [Rhizobium leguminosarum]